MKQNVAKINYKRTAMFEVQIHEQIKLTEFSYHVIIITSGKKKKKKITQFFELFFPPKPNVTTKCMSKTFDERVGHTNLPPSLDQSFFEDFVDKHS